MNIKKGIIFTYATGRALHYRPTLDRGCEQTRKFAAHSKANVELGGMSIVYDTQKVTAESVDSAIAHLQKIRALMNPVDEYYDAVGIVKPD